MTTFFLQTGYRIIIVFDKLLSIEPTNQEIIATGVNQDLRTAFDQLIQDYGAIDSQSVIVLIPAYNEEGSVGEVIEQVPEVVLGLKTQIVVINDGSTDGTAAVARSKGALVLDMPTNSGQGAALKAGYLLALQNNVQYVAVVDGDGQWDPIDIEPLLAPLVKDEADFSQGSRKLGSTEVGDPVRDIGVSVFNRIISGLLGQEVGFGSYAPQYFFSLVAPYLFGGPGAFNIPGYFGPFNWEEVIIYSTIGPVIALISTVARLIRRTLQSELIPYFAMAVVSVLLALGGHTPLESLLYHLPLYGKQRLSGRNILVFDTSIIVFFTFWLDRILKSSQKNRLKLALLTFSPSVLITVLYLAFIAKPVQVERFFKASASPLYLTKSLELEIYLIQLVVALVAGYCYYKAASGTITTRRSKQFIVATVLIDLLAFNIFGTFGTPSYLDIFRSTSPQMELVHSAIGSNYRFALYNPNLYSYSQTMAYGQPNLNIAAGNMSIQGYSSLSLKNYQEATGSHAQATLDPKLLASPLVNQLGTKLILTNWRYLIEPYGSPTLVPIPQVLTPSANNSNPHSTTRSISTSGYFGRLLNVKGLDLHLGSQFQPSSIVKVGLLQKGGSILWLSRSNSKSQPTGALHFSPSESKSKPINAIGVVIHQNLSAALSDPSNALAVGVGVSSTNGYFAMHGSLTSYLTYPHFIFNGITHDVSSFTNAMAQPILKPASSSVKILQHSTLLNGTLKLQVVATKTSYINWAETTAPGWKVNYQAPNSSTIRTLPVSTRGITQKIAVPRGTWYITVYYHPSSAYEGIAISLVSLAAFLILLTYPKVSRKKSSLKL